LEKSDQNSDHFLKRSPEGHSAPGSKPTPEKLPDEKGFLRFSGVAFEMLATIAAGTYFGYLMDVYFALSFPVFLITLSMVSLVISLFLLYRRLPKD